MTWSRSSFIVAGHSAGIGHHCITAESAIATIRILERFPAIWSATTMGSSFTAGYSILI
jgi:hypothetical protein